MDLVQIERIYHFCANEPAVKYAALLAIALGCSFFSILFNGTGERVIIGGTLMIAGAIMLAIFAPILLSFAIGVLFFGITIRCFWQIDRKQYRNATPTCKSTIFSIISVVCAINVIVPMLRL